MRSALLSLGVLLVTSGAIPAQEFAVARRAYTFLDRDLTIEVIADGPGAIQIVRGEPGRVEVAAHTRDGLAAAALGGWRRDHLRLSALGATDADYVVVVPEDVHVSVALPGEDFPRSVSFEPAARLRWGNGAEPAPAFYGILPALLEGLYAVQRGGATPETIELPDAAALNSVEVRISGTEFVVESSRPLRYAPGGSRLAIRTGQEPLDLVITLPADTRRFQLLGTEGALVRVENGRIMAACQPSVAVALPDRQAVTLRPGEGRLRCR